MSESEPLHGRGPGWLGSRAVGVLMAVLEGGQTVSADGHPPSGVDAAGRVEA